MDFISLKEASENCAYSQDYLSLRARQGKLKAAKLGRNWVTTLSWLQEYVGSPPPDTEEKTLVLCADYTPKQYIEREHAIYPPKNLPVYDEEAETLEDDYPEDIARQKAFAKKVEVGFALAVFLAWFVGSIALWGSDIGVSGAYFAWLSELISIQSY